MGFSLSETMGSSGVLRNIFIWLWERVVPCRKLANRHIHNWGSVSKQNHVQEGLKYQSITNCPWPTAILPSGCALRMYAIHPARIAGLKLSSNSSTVWAMAARLSSQCDPRYRVPYAPENDTISIIRIIDIIGIIHIITIILILTIIVNYEQWVDTR